MFDPGVPDTFVDLFARWGLEIGRHPLADPISNVGGEVLSPLVRRSNGQLPAGMPITESLVEVFFPGAASIGALRSKAAAPLEGLIDLAPLAVTTSGSWQETDPAQPDSTRTRRAAPPSRSPSPSRHRVPWMAQSATHRPDSWSSEIRTSPPTGTSPASTTRTFCSTPSPGWQRTST